MRTRGFSHVLLCCFPNSLADAGLYHGVLELRHTIKEVHRSPSKLIPVLFASFSINVGHHPPDILSMLLGAIGCYERGEPGLTTRSKVRYERKALRASLLGLFELGLPDHPQIRFLRASPGLPSQELPQRLAQPGAAQDLRERLLKTLQKASCG